MALAGSLGLVSYLPLAALGFWPVWTHWSSQLNGCNCWDQLLLEWFIHWTPSAVTHGHSVLVTNYLDAPGGINVMWNTSLLALGSLAAPLTQTIGVVHTMAILLTLSFALVGQQHVRPSPPLDDAGCRRPGSAVSSTAFLPSRWQKRASGRITYVFAVAPPLIVLVIDKLIKQEWPPLVGGSVIGLLAAFQLFVSEEILSIICFFLGLDIDRPRRLLPRRSCCNAGADVLRIVGAALVTFAVLCAYPLFVQFFGADRITGSTAVARAVGALQLRRSEPHHPGGDAVGRTTAGRLVSRTRSLPRSAGEVTCYVGIPLLLLLVGTVVLLRKRILVRIFAADRSC